jgi:hypothetical protein
MLAAAGDRRQPVARSAVRRHSGCTCAALSILPGMPRQIARSGPARWLSPTGWLGVALGVIGAALFVVGWWQISGESLLALQLPYLVSASLPGAALVVAGACLLAGESTRQSAADSADMVATLFELLTESSAPATAASTRTADHAPTVGVSASDAAGGGTIELLALPGATRYHRSGCVLVEGKPASVVGAESIRARDLRPCPICMPPGVDG